MDIVWHNCPCYRRYTCMGDYIMKEDTKTIIFTLILGVIFIAMLFYMTKYVIIPEQNKQVSCFMCCDDNKCSCTDVYYSNEDNLCHYNPPLFETCLKNNCTYHPVNKTALVLI